MATIVQLDIMKVGYNIHSQAESIIRMAKEPTIVEMIFVGENNIRREYSRNCITDDTLDIAVEAYTHMLKCHDWYYDYSDDHRYWSKGRNERDDITWAQKKLTERGFDPTPLYNQYCPWKRGE
jgi:hypothetical protein